MATQQSVEPVGGEQQLFENLGFAGVYERALVGPLFDPWVGELLDDVNVGRGDRLLDVACGTGIVARRAKDRVGERGVVVGVDLNAQMLGVARQVAPHLDWREGDVTALPLREDERFDAVVCQQGFQFFPDRAAAAGEMRRALVEGGRLGVSTWRPDEDSPVLHALREVAERRVGPIEDRRHALGEPEPVEEVLRNAGFEHVRSKQSSRMIRFADGATFVRLNAMAMIGMSADGRTLSEQDRQRLAEDIVGDSTELVRRHTDAAGFAYELKTNVVLARAGGA